MEKKVVKPPGIIADYEVAFYLKAKERHLNIDALLKEVFTQKVQILVNKPGNKQAQTKQSEIQI